MLILLAALAVPRCGMAKTVMPTSQMYDQSWDACAVKNVPLLTAGELFTIRVLPENDCFDSPEQTCIQTGWIGIAERTTG